MAKAIDLTDLLFSTNKSNGVSYGLNTLLPDYYFDKIWEMIVKRYQYLKQRGLIYDT